MGLQRVDLSRNQFTGSVPEEIGKLVNVEIQKLSDNRLTGEIPITLSSLSRLTELQMGGNLFFWCPYLSSLVSLIVFRLLSTLAIIVFLVQFPMI